MRHDRYPSFMILLLALSLLTLGLAACTQTDADVAPAPALDDEPVGAEETPLDLDGDETLDEPTTDVNANVGEENANTTNVNGDLETNANEANANAGVDANANDDVTGNANDANMNGDDDNANEANDNGDDDNDNGDDENDNGDDDNANGGDENANEGTGDVPAGDASVVEVTEAEWVINMPASLPAGPTVFEVTNTGAVVHSFEVEGQNVEAELEDDLQPGETGTLEVDLEPGTYTVYCPISGHDELGMELELVVTE